MGIPVTVFCSRDAFRREMMSIRLYNPIRHAVISGVTDADPKQALADLKRDEPDSYALLTEHLDIPDRWIP